MVFPLKLLYESSSGESGGEEQEQQIRKVGKKTRNKRQKAKPKDLEAMVDVEDLGPVMNEMRKAKVSFEPMHENLALPSELQNEIQDCNVLSEKNSPQATQHEYLYIRPSLPYLVYIFAH